MLCQQSFPLFKKKKEIKKTLIPSIPSILIKRTTCKILKKALFNLILMPLQQHPSQLMNQLIKLILTLMNNVGISFITKIEELKRKLKKANEKLQIADTVVYEAEKAKRNLLQQIRKLKSQKRLRIEKSLLKSSKILRKVFNNDQIE